MYFLYCFNIYVKDICEAEGSKERQTQSSYQVVHSREAYHGQSCPPRSPAGWQDKQVSEHLLLPRVPMDRKLESEGKSCKVAPLSSDVWHECPHRCLNSWANCYLPSAPRFFFSVLCFTDAVLSFFFFLKSVIPATYSICRSFWGDSGLLFLKSFSSLIAPLSSMQPFLWHFSKMPLLFLERNHKFFFLSIFFKNFWELLYFEFSQGPISFFCDITLCYNLPGSSGVGHISFLCCFQMLCMPCSLLEWGARGSLD